MNRSKEDFIIVRSILAGIGLMMFAQVYISIIFYILVRVIMLWHAKFEMHYNYYLFIVIFISLGMYFLGFFLGLKEEILGNNDCGTRLSFLLAGGLIQTLPMWYALVSSLYSQL